MKQVIAHIPIDPKKRPGTKMKAMSITIHNTGNPESTAKNERGWLTNPRNTRYASFHNAIDENENIECIPHDEVAYHSGTKEGNNTSIGIEICESGDYAKNVENAVEVVANLLQEHGWGVERLKRHYDWSGKVCPKKMHDGGSWIAWEDFKRQVQYKLDENKIPNIEKIQVVSSWAKEAWEWAIKNNLTDGTNPKGSLTREQLITILHRYDNLK